MSIFGRTTALHQAFWRYDPWYRYAWMVWPSVTALLLAGWLFADRSATAAGNWSRAAGWAKPIDCTNTPGNPRCRQKTVRFYPDFVRTPALSNQTIVAIDPAGFSNSADRQKLVSALGNYYRGDWARTIDILKAANDADPNVALVTALALISQGTFDSGRNAQTLLRKAMAAGNKQAGGILGRTMFITVGGLPKDELQGRKLIEEAAATGDPYAMLLAGVAYQSREFGTYDAAKAADYIRKAADAGDPVALLHWSWLLFGGSAGVTRDEEKSIAYLRRAAEAGLTEAQFQLAYWIFERYRTQEIDDLAEGVKWYERAYQQGFSFDSLGNLALGLKNGRAPPWSDAPRSFALLRLCEPYAHAHCHNLLGLAYLAGAGTSRNLALSVAHYTVAHKLGNTEAAAQLRRLDPATSANERKIGAEQAEKISAGLRPTPLLIALQYADAASTVASPWSAQSVQVSQPRPAQDQRPPERAPVAAAQSEDWPACRGGDGEKAIAACTRIIDSGITGVERVDAYYNLGNANEGLKRYPQALTAYNEAIRLNSSHVPSLNNRGVAHLGMGNLDSALKDFDEAIRANPSYALGYSNRADVYNRQKQPDKAIVEASQAIRLEPRNARAYWIRAFSYELKRQWAAGIADCSTALEIDPKYGACFDRRGFAYAASGKPDQAVLDYTESLRLQPKSPWTLVQRGDLYLNRGQADLAIADFNEAINQQPNYARAYANRGDAHLVSKRYGEAISDASKAIELDKSYWLAYAVRARAKFEQGQLQDAIIDFNDALARNNSPSAYYHRGVAQARIEEQAFENCPRQGSRPNNNVGGVSPVCMRGLQYTDSLADFNNAIKYNPSHADAYSWRGYIYIRLKQREQGIADLRKALEISPNHAGARRILQSVGVNP